MRIGFGRAVAAAALAIAAGMVAPGAATAGAWTQQPGAGQVISSFGRRADPITGIGGGDVEDDSTFTSVYAEYGLAEGLTIGGQLFVEIVTAETGANNAEVGLFLRRRLWRGQEGDVASVQIGAVQPFGDLLGGDFGGPNGDPTQELSIRGQYGRGFGFDWGSAFVSLEAGFHYQLDDDDDEVRADATVGGQPWECCMVLLSAFGTFPVGDEEAALKIAPSVTYGFFVSDEARDAGRRTTLQVGLSQDVLTLDEGLGFQIGIWEAF